MTMYTVVTRTLLLEMHKSTVPLTWKDIKISNDSQDKDKACNVCDKLKTWHYKGRVDCDTSLPQANWAQTKRNTMYGTVLTKKKILNLIPCASLCLNSPYLIYYYFSGKNNNIVGCTSTHSLYNCAQGGDNQKPGINVSFRFTVKLSLKSLNTKEHCSISWLLLTKGVLKKHIQDWITSGNGTLTETIGGEMRQLCVIKTSVDMAILWFPGAWHTDCRWISAR